MSNTYHPRSLDEGGLGQLRPDSFSTICGETLHKGLFIGSDTTNVHLFDVNIHGDVDIRGRLVTGRIYLIEGANCELGGNPVTVVRVTREQLANRAGLRL